MKTNQHGFTLIELMIVVAIIAILAAIALPAYQDYIARSQAAAGLADIRGGVTAVEEIINRGTGTIDNVSAGLAAATPRCSSITVTGSYAADPGTGILTCNMVGNPKVNGKAVILTRNATGQYECTIPGLDAKYLPTGCT